MMPPSDQGQELARVKENWSKRASAEDLERRKVLNWMSFPYIDKHYINRQISGQSDENWLLYFKRKYVPRPRGVGLSLGCGDGSLERHAVTLKICERMEAFDVAEGAVDRARAQAADLGLEASIVYGVTDINTISLEEGKYDIVFAVSAAHHFAGLEHIFDEVRRSLKPDGLFVLYEFVGPSQFQWTDRQLEIVNDLLGLLPDRYKQNLSAPGELKERHRRPSLEEMKLSDPSEAIRSAEILPLLSERFTVLEKIDYGGTILHLLLQDIVGNFDPETEEDRAVVDLLCYLEEILIEHGVLPSDFAFIIAQNKGPEPDGVSGSRSDPHDSEAPAAVIDSHRLSGREVARQVPVKTMVKAICFKLAARRGFGWLHRFRGLGKRALGGF